MKFLLDENMPYLFLPLIKQLGVQAEHVYFVELSGADDEFILEYAQKHAYIIVTHDLDFSRLVAINRYTLPSIITFRSPTLTEEFFEFSILHCIENYEKALQNGSMITITPTGIRIKKLPV